MEVVLDDRLLIEHLLVGLDARGASLSTTTYWHYRACRAAVAGASGHLSGPFVALGQAEQRRAIGALLRLSDDIGLPDPRSVVPRMVEVATRHPSLNLLNLEAVAVALDVGATVWLSAPGAAGVLPGVLDTERISWERVELG